MSKLFFIVILTFFTSVFLGQSYNTRFYRYTTENGLPQNSVYAIVQDHYGYLWIGTEDGLARFDGYSFEVYKNDPSDSNSISNNVIMCLFEDSRWNLWVGTAYGGITILDSTRKKVIRLQHDPENPNSLISNRVQDIKEDAIGNIWIGTAEGVDRYDPETGQIQHFSANPISGKGLSHKIISRILVHPNGKIWIGTMLRGINIYDPLKQKFSYITMNNKNGISLPEDRTRSLYLDPLDSQTVWVGMRLTGLLKLNIKNNIRSLFSKEKGQLPSNYITAITRDFQGRLWVGTPEGIALFDSNDSLLTFYKNIPTNSYSISSNDITTLYLDHTGVLWIGTLSGGLNRCDTKPSKFKWFTYWTEPGKGLNNPLVWAILKTRNGKLWVGTDKGITVYNKKRQVEKYITSKNSRLKTNYIQALYQNAQGKIFIGTYRGLYVTDEKGEHIKEISISNKKNSLANSVLHFAPAQNGNLWIGTENGLVLLNTKNYSVERYLASSLSPPKPSSVIYSIVPEKGEPILWLGTYGNGVIKYNYETQARTFINSSGKVGRVLSNDYVFVIRQDPMNPEWLWIGTRTGLNRLNKKNNFIKYYTEKNGLPNDVIYGILFDAQGNLWLSTNNGISLFDPHNETFKNYDLYDGIQSTEFNARAYFQAPDGELFFGGINGFNAFIPQKMGKNPFHVLPVIRKVFIRDKVYLERENILHQLPTKLNYNQNLITFFFYVPDYTAPEKNYFAYQLQPLEDYWRYTEANKIEYTNLSPGNYTLRIKYRNSDGNWLNEYTELSFIIAQPPWKTWWAYLIYFGVAGLVVFGIIKYRIGKVKKEEQLKRAELRAQIAEAEKRAIEIENQKKTEEMERARELQLAMLPQQPPHFDYLEIETFMQTASVVGGDYYDFIPIDSRNLIAVLGDATGHGLPAGMTVALTKSGLHAIENLPPVEILKRLNFVLKEILADKLYMALQLLYITPNTITMSTAAMPPVYFYNKRMKKLIEILLPTLPLGTRLPENYQEITINFEPGDTIVLMSDGLPERMNAQGIPLGYESVKETIEENIHLDCKSLLQTLVDLGEKHASGQKIYDDLTIMVLRYKE